MRADTRIFDDSDYFLPQEFVDRFADEVKPRTKNTTDPSYDDAEDGAESPADVLQHSAEGDPTDGSPDRPDYEPCTQNWKAAASDEKKKMWAIFDETGIFASACRHGFILWLIDMVKSGEL